MDNISSGRVFGQPINPCAGDAYKKHSDQGCTRRANHVFHTQIAHAERFHDVIFLETHCVDDGIYIEAICVQFFDAAVKIFQKLQLALQFGFPVVKLGVVGAESTRGPRSSRWLRPWFCF